MASDLATELHHVPHYDFKFQSVSSDFDPKNSDYQEALAQIALPLVVLALILVVVKICLACRARKQEIFSHYRPTDAVCSRWTAYVSLLLVIGCAVLCIFGTVQMSTAVNDFTDRTSETVALLDSLQGMCNDNAEYALNDALIVRHLNVSAQDENDKTELVNNLVSLSNTLNDATNAISGAVRIDQWNDDIHKYDKLRYIVALVLSSLLGAFCVFMILAIMCRSHGGTRCFAFLVVAAFFACWVVGAGLFSASVAVSDFCVDPDTAVTKTIDEADADYYITCGTFPYQSYFDDAGQLLARARTVAVRMDKYGNFTGAVDGFTERLNTLHARLLCNGGLHQEYEGAVAAICDDGLKSVFKSAVGLIVAGLCFVFVMFVTRSIVDAFDEDNNYYRRPMVNEIYNERSLLLATPKGYGTSV